MNSESANIEMLLGLMEAREHLKEGLKHPKGSPEFVAAGERALKALEFANDDDVIDALYDADMEYERIYGNE